jgi:hypothetical protein
MAWLLIRTRPVLCRRNLRPATPQHRTAYAHISEAIKEPRIVSDVHRPFVHKNGVMLRKVNGKHNAGAFMKVAEFPLAKTKKGDMACQTWSRLSKWTACQGKRTMRDLRPPRFLQSPRCSVN